MPQTRTVPAKLNLIYIGLGESKFLGYRVKDEQGKAGAYQWLSYAQVRERVDYFASGVESFVQLPEKANIGIYSINRVEWVHLSLKG